MDTKTNTDRCINNRNAPCGQAVNQESNPLEYPVPALLKAHPYLHDFFDALLIPVDGLLNDAQAPTLKILIDGLDEHQLAPFGLNRSGLTTQILDFMA